MVKTNRPEPAPILIAGGGIGGLTTAIALAQRGIASHILEQRARFTAAGAGIQIGPNGTRLLQNWGIAKLLQDAAGVPDSIHVFNAGSGQCVSRLPLGAWIAARHGAPYWVLHRRDLQDALLATARTLRGITITMDFAVQNVEQGAEKSPGQLEVQSRDGASVTGRALIGADGIWSQIRRTIFNAPPLHPCGMIAVRAVVPSSPLRAPFNANATGVWLSPNAHVVHYPVNGGTDTAIVLILSQDPAALERQGVDALWDGAFESSKLKPYLTAFAPELAEFLRAVPDWRCWTLYDPPVLPRWHAGRVVLLGDAAHPVLPFLAQGAVMALEDADAVAAAIEQHGSDLPAAFAAYAAARQNRISRVQSQSRRNGRIYHMSRAGALARDMTMKLAGPVRLMQHYDWLYGWQPVRGTM